MITRLRLDANLFRPAPRRRPGQRGRTPLKGQPLPKLSAVLKNKKTVWTSVVVAQWYNARQHALLVATGTALWYHAGIPPVPIRWVLVRDPSGEHEPAAFLSTDLEVQRNRCDGSTYEFSARVVMMPTVVVDGGRGDGRHGAGRKLVWRCGSRWRSPPTVVRG
jgi:hypothetical protein